MLSLWWPMPIFYANDMDRHEELLLVGAISELTKAIDSLTQNIRDDRDEAVVFKQVIDRAQSLARRIKHVAKDARALDDSTKQ